MENFDSKLSESLIATLRQAASWARFLAILGYIGIGFMVLAAIFFGISFSFLQRQNMPTTIPFPPVVLSVFYLILGAIYYFPIKYLYDFSARVRELNSQHAQEVVLQKAFTALKNHYQFIGIYTIAIFALYFLALIGVLVVYVLL